MRKTSSTVAKKAKPAKKAPKAAPVVPDISKAIIEGCREQEDGMFNGMMTLMDDKTANGMLTSMVGGMVNVATSDGKEVSFAAIMAMESLLQQEERILRLEPNHVELQAERERYIKMRKTLKGKLGKGFESTRAEMVKGHNDCARMNLDASKGTMYSYVLPKFNDDASHGPVGDKDYPWGQVEKPTC